MKKYEIIEEFQLEKFKHAVERYLEDGWQLVGGVSVTLVYLNSNRVLDKDGRPSLLMSQAVAK